VDFWKLNALENLQIDTLAQFDGADFCVFILFILLSEIVFQNNRNSEFSHAGISFLYRKRLFYRFRVKAGSAKFFNIIALEPAGYSL
jgi:hypothetical protein